MKPYENCKVLGPYYRPDGRQHVVVIYPDKTKSTVSFPKYFYEIMTGYTLDIDEIVHHIDGDFTNNSLSNLEVVKRQKHSRSHQTKYTDGTIPCSTCGKDIFLTVIQKRTLVRNKSNGPYCKVCKPVNQYT